MDATTIDSEFAQLQTAFQDVATTVQALVTKMQAAEKAGDANATEWLGDLRHVAQDIDEEQGQVKSLLLAIHDFVGGVAQTTADPNAQQQQPQHHGMLGGMLGGGMMGGGMFGGYYGGGFGRAMEMGMAMNLGANLIGSVFR